MATKKPSKISILGQDIKIVYHAELEADGVECFGLYYSEKHLIIIKNDSEWRAHLLHETIHAIMDITGCTELITAEKEEGIVCACESGLKDIYHLNHRSKKINF